MASFIRYEDLLMPHSTPDRRRAALEVTAESIAFELPRLRLRGASRTASADGSPSEPPAAALDEELIRKMRRFAHAPALRRLAVLIEASLVGQQDNASIHRHILAFRLADRAGLGVLTAADLAEALREHGIEPPTDLELICRCVDMGKGQGAINLIEFVAATMEPRLYCEPRLCRAAFRVLDADGDGAITVSDLEALLADSPQRAETARAIIHSARPDADGRIDFKRFCEVLVPKLSNPGLATAVAAYMAESFV